ncbi:YunG family protein [Streptomyces sp. NRRL F-5123]|uniref:YunG family protein n=1 Tax=Streptomyces sp. NRRL F-5123 TaxID=1463856 RepID=UPI000A540A69|nr:hypothetical protein [Streptomyces sp. NRRL F-5123]
MTVLSLLDLDRALRASWAADTCSPDDVAREAWSPGNPAWGHCDISALLVHDLLGGDLVVGEVDLAGDRQGYHWWNALPSGLQIDVTKEQFRRGQRVTGARRVVRPPGPLPRRWEEYIRLRERVAGHLGGPLPAPGGGSAAAGVDSGASPFVEGTESHQR